MTRQTPANAPLRGLEQHNIGIALSDPLSARLDALVDLVEDTGERTNRKELVAGLILAAAADGRILAALVRRYRTAAARDTLIVADPTVAVLVFPPRSPGPRKRA
jgi:hypothetical protein